MKLKIGSIYLNLDTKRGIELLKAGNILFVPGKNLDRLSRNENGTYSWVGISDQSPTILEESELSSLFENNEFIINL